MRRHINIIALLAIIILSGCKREDDLIPVAKISFKDTYTAEFTSVTLNCDVKSNVTIETLHIEYSTSKDMSESQQIEMSLTKDNTYSATIPNLSIQTEYYYRFVVGNQVSEFFDDQKRTFKTLDYIAPVVHTEDASNISGTKATLKGVVEFACEKPILEQGFMVGTKEDNLKAYKVDGSDFTFNIENLHYKTTYYYRAYAKNDIGTGLGELKTLETCGAVSFNEIKLSSVTANSATIEAGVADNGGIEVDEQGIRYCVKGNDEVTFVETTGSITLKNLKHDTTYEVWGYAKTFEGEFESEKVEFNTKDGKVLITTSSPSDVTTSSATLKGSITSDGGSKITERGFCYSVNDIPTIGDTKLKVDGEIGEYETQVKSLPQNVKYNYRAYAINGIGTYYGEVVSFTTLYDSATFGKITSSDITASSISLSCSITSNGGSTITKCGFCYSTYKNPTIDDEIVVVSDSKTNLNTTIKGLKSGTTYYVRAFATNANSTFYSDEISFVTSEGIIQFSDPTTSNIAAASIIISSNVLSAGGGTITERGFCFDTAPNPTASSNKVTCSGTVGEYSATLSNLQNKTIHYIRAYAINESGTYYSKEINVKTLDGVASLSTGSPTNIKAQSVSLSGEITSDGGSNITERGFCYSTSEYPTVESEHIKIDETIGTMSYELTGLKHSTMYFVRSYAKNGYGTHYGNQVSFTTSTGVVTFDEIISSNITVSSATLSLQIVSDGDSNITQRGYCYSTSTKPTISDNMLIVSGTTGNMTGNITGLTNGERYYVRAFAANAIGTHYSKETSITTLTGLADVSTSAVTNILAESATLNGSINSANGGIITARGFCFSTSENPTIDNTKVLVSGTEGSMSTSIDALEENTTYYVKAFATTSFGTTYGEQVSFITKNGIASLGSTSSSNILANSVEISSSIITDGGSSIIEKGFCYSTSSMPTIAGTKIISHTNSSTYSSVIDNLECSTTYYIRAYATNNIGTYYADEITITTDNGIASLSSLSVSNVGQTTVDAMCTVTDDGGTDILSRGFCYSTTANPSINSEKVLIDGKLGNIAYTLNDLISDQDYYIRGFVETAYKTTYSNEVLIHTIEGLATLGNEKVVAVNETSATISAELISEGGATVSEIGFCYGIAENPTVNDTKITTTPGLGAFQLEITDLTQYTTYYIRPFAITEYGIRYGKSLNFTTKYYPVVFGSISLSAISPKTAFVECPIESDGGNEILEYGVCYSANPSPSINNQTSVVIDGTALGIGGLAINTQYYAKVYIKNKIGVFYSDEIGFSTLDVPDGVIPGLFSISDTEQVYFAKGNLVENDGTWTILDNQIDYIGKYDIYWKTNPNTFYGLSGERDFFFPNETSDITNATISNVTTTGWSLLSTTQWKYVINSRGLENFKVTINGVKGLMILPNAWIKPQGINMPTIEYEEIVDSDWEIMQSEGAVFIPYCGYVKYNESSNTILHFSYSETNSYGYYMVSDSGLRHYAGDIAKAYIFDVSEKTYKYVSVDKDRGPTAGVSFVGAVRLVKLFSKTE